MRIISLLVLCIVLTITNTQTWNYEDQAAWVDIGSCGGSYQSPIDIPCQEFIVKCHPKKSYSFHWKKPFFDIQMTVAQDLQRQLNMDTHAVLKFSNQTNDYQYILKSFHWRRGSQHSINGKFYDLQLHLYHALDHPTKSEKAVLVVFFEVDNTLAADVFDHFELYDKDFSSLKIHAFTLMNGPAYHYRGSMSKPPCTQMHNYIVQKQPIKITRRNLNNFIAGIRQGKPNARITQRLGNRQVHQIGNHCSSGSSTAPSTQHS